MLSLVPDPSADADGTDLVDSHQHFWQVGRFDYPWMSPAVEVLCQDHLPPKLEPILRGHGVKKTVLVQASNSLAETRWLLDLADQNRFIGGVVGWVDLTAPHCEEQLAGFTAHPRFKGVRHLVESEPADDWLAQPAVLANLGKLARHDVAFDLLVHTRHLRFATALAKRCPDLRLVVDHLAKPPIARGEIDEWSRGLKELAACQNVWCKLSGLVTEAKWTSWQVEDLQPYVDRALEYFGPQRMMFGSDWPVCLLAASYDQVLNAAQALVSDLSDANKRRIFAGNALEFYRIDGKAKAA
jgi:L-fuconolactonase